MVTTPGRSGQAHGHGIYESPLLIKNALQDQEVMPLLSNTVVGPSIGKMAEMCPFSVLYVQWEDALTVSERARAQQELSSWHKCLAYPCSELPGRKLFLSKLAWGRQLPTSCPWEKGTDDGMLLLQGRNDLPTKNFMCSHTYLKILEVL